MNGYKYRANIAVNDKGNLRDIETLIKDELWASSLTDLNDPFEATYIDNIERALALFESVFGANIKDVKKYWEELILFKNKHKLIHNQAPVMNRLCPFLLNLHK